MKKSRTRDKAFPRRQEEAPLMNGTTHNGGITHNEETVRRGKETPNCGQGEGGRFQFCWKDHSYRRPKKRRGQTTMRAGTLNNSRRGYYKRMILHGFCSKIKWNRIKKWNEKDKCHRINRWITEARERIKQYHRNGTLVQKQTFAVFWKLANFLFSIFFAFAFSITILQVQLCMRIQGNKHAAHMIQEPTYIKFWPGIWTTRKSIAPRTSFRQRCRRDIHQWCFQE